MAERLARMMGWSEERRAQLHEAGLLHDVGKIGVPDAVLFKPGRLTREEFELVKLHAPLGAQIAAEVLTDERSAGSATTTSGGTAAATPRAARPRTSARAGGSSRSPTRGT